MSYIENPKTKDSGIYCCIPQLDRCPNNCEECFFNSGRSYLEPLDTNLPNIPTKQIIDNYIIRINDGNDSNFERETVINVTKDFPNKFYNTSLNKDLDSFPGPVVLTINPRNLTDEGYIELGIIPKNLMFVRVRVNSWNLEKVVDGTIKYYTEKEVPVILTFMAYYRTEIPEQYKGDYVYRKRTLNSYWAITTEAWERIMNRYKNNILVYSCGKIEGEKGKTGCKYCGNCLREYYNTKRRLEK